MLRITTLDHRPKYEGNPTRHTTGLRRLARAVDYSLSGITDAVRHEQAFRQEIVALVLLVPLAAWLGQDGIERAMLIGSLILVLIAELFNSAIEATVDRISLEDHSLSKRAKDMGSAAVMLTICNVCLVWVLVLARQVP